MFSTYKFAYLSTSEVNTQSIGHQNFISTFIISDTFSRKEKIKRNSEQLMRNCTGRPLWKFRDRANHQAELVPWLCSLSPPSSCSTFQLPLQTGGKMVAIILGLTSMPYSV